jgi:hypothetical protein
MFFFLIVASEFNVLSTNKTINHFHEIKKIEPKIK